MAEATSPSELLTRAADRIRDLAAAAVPAPWDSALAEVDHPGPYEREMVADCGDSRTADWIAALSPAVAPHLETIFRESARRVALGEAVNGGAHSASYTESRFGSVLALARTLLGEAKP